MYMFVCMYNLGKTGTKSDSMKMFQDEKTQGLQKMILFVEIFVNIKHFSF